MAYAYPGALDRSAATSATSLVDLRHTREPSRKNSDALSDVISEFKHKITEDEIYINFLQERTRLEKEYIEGLRRLYDRTLAIDSLHDDAPPPKRSEKPTSRRAWAEVRDYTLREIEAREAMTEALKEDVIQELMRIKDQQTKVKNSLKENIKLADNTYEEHAKHHVPKLKKIYFQKSLALEDHRRQEHAIAMQARLLASPSPPSPGVLQEHPFAVATGPSYTSPPTANPPLPAMSNPVASSHSDDVTGRDHGHSPSVSMSIPSPNKDREKEVKFGNRLRAGSGSGLESKSRDVLNDIAAQGRKGFSAFMQKLGGDKDRERDEGMMTLGGLEGEGLQRRGTTGSANSKAMLAVRGAKAKREADDADKAYRLGVFHLESLRIRREKLHASAITHLEEFNDELSKNLRTVMDKYIDIMHSTAATSAQATEVARMAVDAVDADYDMRIFRQRLYASIGNAARDPIPYENFFVGPCRSLIFGVGLSDYDFARGDGSDHGRPPTIIEKCIAAIDDRGLLSEGIYRVNGRHAAVQKMIQGIEKDETQFGFDDKDDVFSIASVLKQYLRELPGPVFYFPHADRVKHTCDRESHISSSFSLLRGRLRRLPPIHQTTFQAIIEHLGRVHAKCETNKMGAKNLAVVFNSVLFGQDQMPTDGNVLTMNQGTDTVLEDLIIFSDLLFAAGSPVQSANALLGDSDGYQPGSSRTKFKISHSRDRDYSPESTERPASVTELAETIIVPIVAAEEDSVAPTTTKSSNGHMRSISGSFTPDDELDLLFDPNLIPASMYDRLPENIHVRPLSSTDLLRNHFALLGTLRPSPALAPSIYQAIFVHLQSCPGTYYVVVMVDKTNDHLVATGTLMIERKHINGGGASGHLEDIVVSEAMQGKKLGARLVNGLRELAMLLGCYKVILDCKEAKIPFYEKCGFHKRSAGMAHYVHENDSLISTSSSNVDMGSPSHRARTLGPPYLEARSLSPISNVSTTPRAPQLEKSVSLEDVALNDGDDFLAIDTADVAASESDSDFPGSPKTFASASSGADVGVTYTFPTDNGMVPAWAADGLGSSSLRGSGPLAGMKDREKTVEEKRELAGTPLPPGAAPPNLDTEPERL